MGKPNNYRFNCSMIKFICSWKLYNFHHGLLQLNWHWNCCWIIIQVCVLSPLVRLSSSYLQYWTYHFQHGLIKIINKPRYFTWWRHQMETFSALLAICAENSPVIGEYGLHKGQWRGALMFSLICAWINGWVLVIWDAIALIIMSW